MTKEKQAQVIQKACLAHGISTHIDWVKGKKDAQSYAQTLACLFRGNEELPMKISYMYCDSLDMCFFFDTAGNARMSYSGVSTLSATDMKEDRLVAAFTKAKAILQTMQELADEPEKQEEVAWL